MTLAEKKALVGDFLARCNRYADEKLAAYREELRTAAGPRAGELREKIRDWSAYRRFNEHALTELETETLDDWFT
ncbi:MAG TPA: hypothetical protein VFV10_20615 [Gammaproteobacteria bacterium]|nr:hypothetical protein [Gammaproteobacteria bacterium]